MRTNRYDTYQHSSCVQYVVRYSLLSNTMTTTCIQRGGSEVGAKYRLCLSSVSAALSNVGHGQEYCCVADSSDCALYPLRIFLSDSTTTEVTNVRKRLLLHNRNTVLLILDAIHDSGTAHSWLHLLFQPVVFLHEPVVVNDLNILPDNVLRSPRACLQYDW